MVRALHLDVLAVERLSASGRGSRIGAAEGISTLLQTFSEDAVCGAPACRRGLLEKFYGRLNFGTNEAREATERGCQKGRGPEGKEGEDNGRL